MKTLKVFVVYRSHGHPDFAQWYWFGTYLSREEAERVAAELKGAENGWNARVNVEEEELDESQVEHMIENRRLPAEALALMQ